jgi:hypothetical protein
MVAMAMPTPRWDQGGDLRDQFELRQHQRRLAMEKVGPAVGDEWRRRARGDCPGKGGIERAAVRIPASP